ncbi:MAG: cell division ATP-binding protein FtsE [Bacilli bacterium]|jgi:cell division transport system ATP-binding protein|nr:cell division ATP-binding protein FtsE [Bacilli bacterium]
MIKFTNVTKMYRKGRVHALNNVSLFIGKGEFVYIIGPTGAGKSTFIKLLYREEKATSGEVEVNGTNLSKIRNSRVPYYRRKIGVVFQDYKLLPKKTVFENIAFALEVIGKSPRVIRKQVLTILQLVGLEDKAKAFPHELSGGQQQRVAIARALINNPGVMIADEPTGNLDPESSKEIMKLLEEISKRGTTIVMVTHDRQMVNTYKHRTITIESGFISNDTMGGGYNDNLQTW